MFNLNMVDIDALGTAHRAATESVYIGDYGAKWAEIDAIRRGKMYKLKNVSGKVEKTLMTEDEKIVMLAVLENAGAHQEDRCGHPRPDPRRRRAGAESDHGAGREP